MMDIMQGKEKEVKRPNIPFPEDQVVKRKIATASMNNLLQEDQVSQTQDN